MIRKPWWVHGKPGDAARDIGSSGRNAKRGSALSPPSRARLEGTVDRLVGEDGDE